MSNQFKLKTVCLILMTSLLAACGVKNKEKSQDTKEGVVVSNIILQGTYAGIVPAADAPGIYRMVALDSASYQAFDKFIGDPGLFFSYGSFSTKGDTAMINGISYQVLDNMLVNQVDTLHRVDNATTLPMSFDRKEINRAQYSDNNYLYTSPDEPSLDVSYLNSDSHFALIIGDSWDKCYLLPQTEAWSKGAIYSKGIVSWTSSRRTAEFKRDGVDIKYVEQNIK